MISANLSAIFYLISGVLFILALRGLSSPETSRQGNLFGILGMIIAITVTFLVYGIGCLEHLFTDAQMRYNMALMFWTTRKTKTWRISLNYPSTEKLKPTINL